MADGQTIGYDGLPPEDQLLVQRLVRSMIEGDAAMLELYCHSIHLW